MSTKENKASSLLVNILLGSPLRQHADCILGGYAEASNTDFASIKMPVNVLETLEALIVEDGYQRVAALTFLPTRSMRKGSVVSLAIIGDALNFTVVVS